MDYYDILYKAQENDKKSSKKEIRCYKTEFAPPKKVEKSKVSSASIQKFLARKEEEEKRKFLEAKKKKEELLALRSQDKKAQKRVQVMLKRTKSANKSVMADAIDNVNTADTLNGPMQCDEDDYGYVSQEASAFYNKLMDKYQNMPTEKSIFSEKRKEVKDLNAAKDRVRAALEREAEEQLHPRRKKRKKEDGSEDTKDETKSEEPEPEEIKKEPENRKKKPNRPIPPPMDFMQLLKIAEKKQHEPIVIEKPIKEKEPERLMTQKEKMEYLKEQERLTRKSNGRKPSSSDISIPKDGKDSKINAKKDNAKDASILRKSLSDSMKSSSQKVGTQITDPSEKLKKPADVWRKPCNSSSMDSRAENEPKIGIAKQNIRPQKAIVKEDLNVMHNKKGNVSPNDGNGVSEELSDLDKAIQSLMKKREMLAAACQKEKPSVAPSALKEKSSCGSSTDKAKSNFASGPKKSVTSTPEKRGDPLNERKYSEPKNIVSPKGEKIQNASNKPKESLVKEELKTKETVKPRGKEVFKNHPKDSDIAKKTFSPPKPKERIPDRFKDRDTPRFQDRMGMGARGRDFMKNLEDKYKQASKPNNRVKKRNVIDSDESEYDSELDDFIDDGDEDIDYSQYIKEIFKYDKSRYRDEEEDDTECMESNFAQQMREEYVSAKIGLLEDLEDIRKEQEEKKKSKLKQKMKR